jgi:sensor domain CHASE-containing protein
VAKNLMEDPDRGPVVTYGRDHDAVTLQGPFDLKQGGQGIAVRNPVFITDSHGNRTFWGFTIAIIKSTDIFSSTLNTLSSYGNPAASSCCSVLSVSSLLFS